MTFQSSKVSIKSPKSVNPEEDFISKLPDALLIQILSLLPEPDANRTRILSNRWKTLWTFLPNLHIIMPYCSSIEEINKFHDSVDQTLAVRDGMPVKRFYLYCSKNCNYDRVYDWVCKVVQSRVQDLELRFPADRYKVRFCWDLFRVCSSLVSLTLRGEFVLHVPDSADILFPCLKKVDLVSIVYSGDKSFANLVSGCPVLEELFVERQLIGRFDNMERFMVKSLSLKRLRLSFALSARGKIKVVVIDAPKLEYLSILDVMSTSYSLTEPLSLTEAHVKIRGGQVEPVALLLTRLSSAKVLTLTEAALTALNHLHGLNMPVFPNLVKFVMGIDYTRGWSILPDLFNCMPNLEHITFLNGFLPFPSAQYIFNMRWSPPMEVPACLQFKMKEIIIKNQETLSPGEYILIRYFLKHSSKLESLTINAHKINSWSRELLLKVHRASKSCRIEFV